MPVHGIIIAEIHKEDFCDMSILCVSGVGKICTTRFGGNQVEALKNVSFEVEQGDVWPVWASPAPGRVTARGTDSLSFV